MEPFSPASRSVSISRNLLVRVINVVNRTYLFFFTDCAVNFIVTTCDAGEYTCEVMVTSDSFFSQRDHLRISPSMFLKNIDRILLFCSRACKLLHIHIYTWTCYVCPSQKEKNYPYNRVWAGCKCNCIAYTVYPNSIDACKKF